MGAACKPQCQQPSEAGDDAGLEPTTPVADNTPCSNVDEAPKEALVCGCAPKDIENKVADAAAVLETEATQAEAEPEAEVEESRGENAAAEPEAEAETARKSEEENSAAAPPPQVETQPAASEEAAAKVQETKDDKDIYVAKPAEDVAAGQGAAPIAEQDEQDAKVVKQGDEHPSAGEDGAPVFTKRGSMDTKKKGTADKKSKVAKAVSAGTDKKKKTAAEDKKHKRKSADFEAEQKDKQDKEASEQKDKQEEPLVATLSTKEKKRSETMSDKSLNLSGWGTPEQLQAIFAQEDEEVDTADLVQEYFQAVKLVQKGKPRKGKISNEEKMTLYGLFKQVNQGDLNQPKPGMLSGLEARGKWNAWNSRRGMEKTDAMKEYIRVVEQLQVKYTVELIG